MSDPGAFVSVPALACELADSEKRAEQRHVETLAATIAAGYIAAGPGNEKVDEPIAARYSLHLAREIIRRNREVAP